MSLKGKYWFLALSLLITASCGFQPIYKIGNETKQLLEFNLNFHNEPSYETKNTIKNAFMGSEAMALYSVNLNVIENQSPLIINSNGTVSKYRVEVMIDFKVHESSSGNKIYSDVSRGFSEYLVQASEIQTNEKYKQAIETAAQEAVQMMSIKIQSNILLTQ